jgi:hypothetical protein
MLCRFRQVIGYSNLLVEEAVERHLGRFIPLFKQIRDAGGELLVLIGNASDQSLEANTDTEGEAFRVKLGTIAHGILRNLDSVVKDPECAHRQTPADFDAISGAIDHLNKLTAARPENADNRQLR